MVKKQGKKFKTDFIIIPKVIVSQLHFLNAVVKEFFKSLENNWQNQRLCYSHTDTLVPENLECQNAKAQHKNRTILRIMLPKFLIVCLLSSISF